MQMGLGCHSTPGTPELNNLHIGNLSFLCHVETGGPQVFISEHPLRADRQVFQRSESLQHLDISYNSFQSQAGFAFRSRRTCGFTAAPFTSHSSPVFFVSDVSGIFVLAWWTSSSSKFDVLKIPFAHRLAFGTHFVAQLGPSRLRLRVTLRNWVTLRLRVLDSKS